MTTASLSVKGVSSLNSGLKGQLNKSMDSSGEGFIILKIHEGSDYLISEPGVAVRTAIYYITIKISDVD